MPWCDRSFEQTVEYETCIGCLQGVIDRLAGACFCLVVTGMCPSSQAQNAVHMSDSLWTAITCLGQMCLMVNVLTLCLPCVALP